MNRILKFFTLYDKMANYWLMRNVTIFTNGKNNNFSINFNVFEKFIAILIFYKNNISEIINTYYF